MPGEQRLNFVIASFSTEEEEDEESDSEDEEYWQVAVDRFSAPSDWVNSIAKQLCGEARALLLGPPVEVDPPIKRYIQVSFDGEPGEGPGPMKEFFENSRKLFGVIPVVQWGGTYTGAEVGDAPESFQGQGQGQGQGQAQQEQQQQQQMETVMQTPPGSPTKSTSTVSLPDAPNTPSSPGSLDASFSAAVASALESGAFTPGTKVAQRPRDEATGASEDKDMDADTDDHVSRLAGRSPTNDKGSGNGGGANPRRANTGTSANTPPHQLARQLSLGSVRKPPRPNSYAALLPLFRHCPGEQVPPLLSNPPKLTNLPARLSTTMSNTKHQLTPPPGGQAQTVVPRCLEDIVGLGLPMDVLSKQYDFDPEVTDLCTRFCEHSCLVPHLLSLL